jgi:hypothetical protein
MQPDVALQDYAKYLQLPWFGFHLFNFIYLLQTMEGSHEPTIAH